MGSIYVSVGATDHSENRLLVPKTIRLGCTVDNYLYTFDDLRQDHLGSTAAAAHPRDHLGLNIKHKDGYEPSALLLSRHTMQSRWVVSTFCG